MPTIVISSYGVSNFPEGGGHFSVYLQYVLGLRQLGYDVYWMEGFSTKGRVEREAAALAMFRARMKQYGFDGKFALYVMPDEEPMDEAPTEYLNPTRAAARRFLRRRTCS